MRQLINLTLAAFSLLLISSCTKTDDPYANRTAETEKTSIDEWVQAMMAKNYDIDTTASGIYYFFDRAGSGATIRTNDTVTVKYTGMLTDGTIFDSSANQTSGNFTFIHKVQRMIVGWEEVMEKSNKGAKVVFIVPSAYAYGIDGGGFFAPYTPLIFVVEIVEIKSTTNQN
jgi:FKBP-type peptidyl-prolyl cis-trans isomerase